MSEEIDNTKNQEWIDGNIDRLLAWEIFTRVAQGKEMVPVAPLDRIGVNKEYVHEVIQQIKSRNKDAK
jgi:hypothetical protein